MTRWPGRPEGWGNSMVKNAQIERLRALKKRIREAWLSHNGPTGSDAVLIVVEDLVEILLMEVEDHD